MSGRSKKSPAPKSLRLSRPATARAVARRAKTMEEFGLNLRDWFHELRLISTRAQLVSAVAIRPPSLAAVFPDGRVADAFLAAQVEYLCRYADVQLPRWTRDPRFVLDVPWFSLTSPRARAQLLRETPIEFRHRNIFTTPEAVLKIRPIRSRAEESRYRKSRRSPRPPRTP